MSTISQWNKSLCANCFLVSLLILIQFPTLFGIEKSDSPLKEAVENDWMAQETAKGRDLCSVAALSDLAQSGESLLSSLIEYEAITPERQETLSQALQEVTQADLASCDQEKLKEFYLALRWEIRSAALENPIITSQPILFHKGDRFVCQMLHEYISYYYQMANCTGGGLYVLKDPGQSFEIESLTDGKFPRGYFTTPSLSYDGKSVYFAFADLSDLPDFDGTVNSTERFTSADIGQKLGKMRRDMVEFFREYQKTSKGKFHLYKMDLENGESVQLTNENYDDFDPIEIPGGDVIFMSTRRGGFGRCHGDWEPLPVHTLHRLHPDNSISTLSWHETNEWQPSVMNDGRILYTRWDYIDRSAAKHHGLWITNPDGTNAISLYGNYTFDINAIYQAKQIPDSNKIIAIAGAHHLDVGGSLIRIDPGQIRYNSEKSEDTLDSVEALTPHIAFPETPGQSQEDLPQCYYFSPFPCTEEFYITAYSNNPLGGMLSYANSCKTGRCGIYYADQFGNLELLYEDPTTSCQYPIPVVQREVPPIIPSQLPQGDVEKTGTLFLSNVYESLVPLPKDRPITELRVFEVFPKMEDHRSNSPMVGYPASANTRSYLGSVPVESDGSAFFRVPAERPLYFQAVDAEGKAVQSMRSEVYLIPGENRGCVGCHEQIDTALRNDPGFSKALEHAPSELANAPEGSSPFEYMTLIQPILDRACVLCHNEQENGVAPILTDGSVEEPEKWFEKQFNRSYVSLKPYLRWYEWGGETAREISTLPGEIGADISPLTKILEDEHHGDAINLTDEEKRIIYLWLDANIPFTTKGF